MNPLALVVGLVAGLGAAGPSQVVDRPVPILIYHRVGDARFRRQLSALRRAGYRGVTLAQVWDGWHDGHALPRKPIVLSFDDGYLSQYRHGARRLKAAGWPGVLNLSLSRLGVAGGLRRSQVRRMLAAGWEVDAHTLTHVDLTRVGAARLHEEVTGSRAAIRREFGVTPDFFCYPYGHFDAVVADAVRVAGFRAATTTRRGIATAAGDPYALPRIRADGRSASALLRALR